MRSPPSHWESPRRGHLGASSPPSPTAPRQVSVRFGPLASVCSSEWGLVVGRGEPLKADLKQQMRNLKKFHFPDFTVVATLRAVGSDIPHAPSPAPFENPEEFDL